LVNDLYQLLCGDNEGADLPPQKKKQSMNAWLQAPPDKSPYVWHNVEALKQMIREKKMAKGESRQT